MTFTLASRMKRKPSETPAPAPMNGAPSFFASSLNRRLSIARASSRGSCLSRVAAVSGSSGNGVRPTRLMFVAGDSGSAWKCARTPSNCGSVPSEGSGCAGARPPAG